VKQKVQDFPAVPARLGKHTSITRDLKRNLGAVAAQTEYTDVKKNQHDECEHRKLLEREMVNFLFEGKEEVHIEDYTPRIKIKKTVPEHASGNTIKQTQRTRADEKKYLALALICAVALISCSTTKRRYL